MADDDPRIYQALALPNDPAVQLEPFVLRASSWYPTTTNAPLPNAIAVGCAYAMVVATCPHPPPPVVLVKKARTSLLKKRSSTSTQTPLPYAAPDSACAKPSVVPVHVIPLLLVRTPWLLAPKNWPFAKIRLLLE